MTETKIKFQSDNYKKKVEFARSFVRDNFDEELIDFIEKEDWEENVELCSNVINDSLTIEDQNYLNKKLNLKHLKDRRTPVEYALDLIIGWILEDGIVKILTEKMGYNCSLSSADKNRKFLKKPEATPDMTIVKENDTEIPIELAQDFTGYWQRKNKIDLRDNKYNKIKNENGVLLGLDFQNEDFFVVNISETEGRSHPHYPYGGKNAYTFSFNNIEFHDVKEMKKVLSEFFDDRN